MERMFFCLSYSNADVISIEYTFIRKQRENLNEENIEFIGINYRDTKTLPDQMLAREFLLRLTTCLYEKFDEKVIMHYKKFLHSCVEMNNK
jgi:hypothetical protein